MRSLIKAFALFATVIRSSTLKKNGLKNFHWRNANHLILFFILQFFFSSILLAKTPEIQEINKIWLTKFFQDVMLDGSAIYSLFGSKPITAISINYYTDEEAMVIYS